MPEKMLQKSPPKWIGCFLEKTPMAPMSRLPKSIGHWPEKTEMRYFEMTEH